MPEAAVLVPAEAPQLSATGSFVYVVRDDDTAELRHVTLGQRQGALVVVDAGLAVGERVVVQGQLGVTPDGKVAVAQPAPAEISRPRRGTTPPPSRAPSESESDGVEIEIGPLVPGTTRDRAEHTDRQHTFVVPVGLDDRLQQCLMSDGAWQGPDERRHPPRSLSDSPARAPSATFFALWLGNTLSGRRLQMAA